MMRTLVSILAATIAVTEAGFLLRARHEVTSLKHAQDSERRACSWIKISLEDLKPFPARDKSGIDLDANRMSVSFTLLVVMESTLGCGGDALTFTTQHIRADDCYVFSADRDCIANAAAKAAATIPSTRD